MNAASPRVSYLLTGSALGRLLVAASDSGICWVSLGDSDNAQLSEMLADFPQAQPAANGRLAGWCAALSGYLAGQNSLPDLPIELYGTSFQQQVWQALRRIPCGQTITYTRLANEIGRPAAVRSAAHACASNRVAILIPCHRVLRTDGSLGGYRWGLERKQALLNLEAVLGR